MHITKRSKPLTLALSLILCAIIGLSFISNNKTIAKADTTNVEYRFKGSNIFLPFVAPRNTSGINKGFYLLSLEFAPILNSSSFTNKYQVVMRSSAYYVYSSGGVTNNNFFNVLTSYANSYNSKSKATTTLDTLRIMSSDTITTIGGYICSDGAIPSDQDLYGFYGRAEMTLNSLDFIPYITTIELGSNTTISDNQVYNYIRYYDINNNYFQLSVITSNSVSWDGQPFPMVLDKRVYYVGDNLSSDYDFGYTQGFNDGEEKGYNEGKQFGIDLGEEQGYWKGYNEGVASANNYGFLGLMTSIVDAPLQVFTKMFDFNLLGVNMSSFYLSLFTACIIIIILKKVL